MLQAIAPQRFKATFNPGPIPLGPITALVGRNGSGKSTVIEALQWLCSALRFGVAAANEQWFGGEHLVNLRGSGDWLAIDLTWAGGASLPAGAHYYVQLLKSGRRLVLDEERLQYGHGARVRKPIRTVRFRKTGSIARVLQGPKSLPVGCGAR